MIDEMKVADEESRELRLRKRLEKELISEDFKKMQRRAFMPMYKNLPDYVKDNHHNPTFLKEKDLLSTKGV